MKTPAPASRGAPADSARRILEAARTQLFRYGYSALTMDDLAAGLGMSKKTLYVHFPSKDALVEQILADFGADVRNMAEALFEDESLSFTERMHRFGQEITQRFTRLGSHVLRDLQRSAPHLYGKIDELRSRNIPIIFGRMIRQGQKAGMVRTDVDVEFAVTYWRGAIQSLLHPDTLERLQLTPPQVFPKALNLFFGGLLTPAGHKDYEKHAAS